MSDKKAEINAFSRKLLNFIEEKKIVFLCILIVISIIFCLLIKDSIIYVPIRGTIKDIFNPDKITSIHINQVQNTINDGLGWDNENNIILNETGIVVILDQHHTNTQIELSFDNNDEYELKYINSKEVVATQIIPPLKGKNLFGLYKVVYDVPAAASLRGFNKIYFRPIKGDGAYSLGHIRFIK